MVRLTGKDGKKLLQGLLTNDVDLLLEDDDNTNTMYAAMLTAKGRIVTDVFLTKGRSDDGGRRNNDEILIDSCQLAKETLLTPNSAEEVTVGRFSGRRERGVERTRDAAFF